LITFWELSIDIKELRHKLQYLFFPFPPTSRANINFFQTQSIMAALDPINKHSCRFGLYDFPIRIRASSWLKKRESSFVFISRTIALWDVVRACVFAVQPDHTAIQKQTTEPSSQCDWRIVSAVVIKR
jgi:uncharacterized protein YecE (DUF72 family)